MTEYIITLEQNDSIVESRIIEGNPFALTGFPGAPGAGGGTFPNNIIETTVSAAGQMVLNLPDIINTGILFINGLVQSKDSFTIAGNTVTLPVGLNLVVGDTIHFYY